MTAIRESDKSGAFPGQGSRFPHVPDRLGSAVRLKNVAGKPLKAKDLSAETIGNL